VDFSITQILFGSQKDSAAVPIISKPAIQYPLVQNQQIQYPSVQNQNKHTHTQTQRLTGSGKKKKKKKKNSETYRKERFLIEDWRRREGNRHFLKKWFMGFGGRGVWTLRISKGLEGLGQDPRQFFKIVDSAFWTI
jgi:hypothetical protein